MRGIINIPLKWHLESINTLLPLKPENSHKVISDFGLDGGKSIYLYSSITCELQFKIIILHRP
jgi:hypothetical protein